MQPTSPDWKARSMRLRSMIPLLRLAVVACSSQSEMEYESLLNAAWAIFKSIPVTSLAGNGNGSTTPDTTLGPDMPYGTPPVAGGRRGTSQPTP